MSSHDDDLPEGYLRIEARRDVPPPQTQLNLEQAANSPYWFRFTLFLIGAVSLIIVGYSLGYLVADSDGNEMARSDEVRELEVEDAATSEALIAVPDVCIIALTHADNAITIFNQALPEAGEDYDSQTLEAASGELSQTLTDYYWNRDECQTFERNMTQNGWTEE